jgi:hypothetical protein
MIGTGSPSSQQPVLETSYVPDVTPFRCQDSMKKNHKNVVVIVAFYGVSCMGKSELVSYVREKARHDEIAVNDVSKDTIARPLLDAYQKANPSVPFQDIYMTIYSNIIEIFINEVMRALASLKPGRNIVIIDDAWADKDLMQRILKPEVAPEFEKKLICVYPKMSSHVLYPDLPFSPQFILNLCHRVIGRKNHETMIYDDLKKVQIVLSFIKLYHGIQDIPSKFREETKFHEFFPVEFHQESHEHHLADAELPPLIEKIYSQMSLCFQKMGAPFETPFIQGKEEVEKLIELIQLLDDPESASEITPYINFGRKTEWDKWFHRILGHMA